MSLRILALTLLFSAVACNSADSSKAPKAPDRADVIAAGSGSVQAEVVTALAQASRDGRRLVVYVGASWCEPCQLFLDATKAGDLPAQLSDLRFLKFDHDSDEDRLNEAGFGGVMIPRFVVPGPGGVSTERRFEGATKGPGAMASIVPRLEGILADSDRR